MVSRIIKILVLIFTGLTVYFCWKKSARTVSEDEDSTSDEKSTSTGDSESSNRRNILNELDDSLRSDSRFHYESCFSDGDNEFMGFIDLDKDGKILISINHDEEDVMDSFKFMTVLTYYLRDNIEGLSIMVKHMGSESEDDDFHPKFDKSKDKLAVTNITVNRGSIEDIKELLHYLMYSGTIMNNGNGYFNNNRGSYTELVRIVEYYPLRIVRR